MGGLTTRVYKGVKGYWRRRGYERLGSSRKSDESGSKPRRRSWRIKMKPKLKVKPKNLLIGLRDAYVRMMTSLANTSVVTSGAIGGISQFGMRPMKEYDEKMIIEIYKSLAMRQAQLAALETPRISCSR